MCHRLKAQVRCGQDEVPFGAAELNPAQIAGCRFRRERHVTGRKRGQTAFFPTGGKLSAEIGWYRVVYTSPHGFWGEVSFCPKPERTEKLRKDRSK